MPREYVILSLEPITAVECIAAAATVDPNLGIGRLWGGGGIQVACETLVLAVLRSTTVGDGVDTAYLLQRALPPGASYATEAYGPFDEPLAETVVRRLAKDVGGTVIEAGA